ncbi:MAG: hypothetical protein ACKPEY_12050, partial [Planctomycetota bacterium]
MGGMGGGEGDPLEMRYVDVNLLPAKAATLRTALNLTSPQDALLAVVKRMPVRLQLTVDIRKLNRLLAECGNAELPLEIRQVRFNRQGAAATGGGGGMAGSGMSPGAAGASMGSPGMAPGAAGASMSPGGGAMSGMGGGPGLGRMGAASSGSENYDIGVEIFGLVYIFNPPNEAKLGGLNKGQTAGAPAASPNQSSGITTPALQPAS